MPIRSLLRTPHHLLRVSKHHTSRSMAYPNDPKTPTELLSALPAHFDAAKRSGELYFFPSEAKDVDSHGWRFNLRSCPALLDKAKAKDDALAAARGDGSPDPKRQRMSNGDERRVSQNNEEPFKPPYVPELFVGYLKGLEDEDGMSILLNKYSLLPEHILLCPTSYQPQNLPPTPPQLALAYHILQAAARHPQRPRKLLAFYNGGEGAGASQKWRHLQFVEVPNGRAPLEDWMQGVQIERQAIVHPRLPYLHIVHPLANANSLSFPNTPESESRLIDELAPALMKSLDLAFDAIRRGGGSREGGWNLLMTLDHLHLIPRSAPSFALPSPHSPLELNSLGYAGMMLVKSDDESSALLNHVGDEGLIKVLSECGVPREWGEMAVEGISIQHGHSALA